MEHVNSLALRGNWDFGHANQRAYPLAQICSEHVWGGLPKAWPPLQKLPPMLQAPERVAAWIPEALLLDSLRLWSQRICPGVGTCIREDTRCTEPVSSRARIRRGRERRQTPVVTRAQLSAGMGFGVAWRLVRKQRAPINKETRRVVQLSPNNTSCAGATWKNRFPGLRGIEYPQLFSHVQFIPTSLCARGHG